MGGDHGPAEVVPGALDHAKPLKDWKLPECFSLLRDRLEREGRARGTREFIRVLRLLEKHPIVAGDVKTRKGPKGSWWDWDTGKALLEYLFWRKLALFAVLR